MHSVLSKKGAENLLLRKQIALGIYPQRTFILGALRSVLKLRYLFLGGGIAGTISLNQTYNSWKDSLPDLKWLEELIPSEETKSNLLTTANGLKNKIKEFQIDPRIKTATEEQLGYWRNWFNKKLEQFDTELEIASTSTTNNLNPNSSNGGTSIVLNRGLINAQTKPTESSRVENLQDEIIKIQLKYQKELEKLERENKELRKQLLIRSKSGDGLAVTKKPKEMRKSLIDMYSEVLDELQGFDINYKTSDHLPRVVVVGDQSSGKTSVLEMIAQARIFPRGSGEMMTRAPVKVTLSEGPYHIAQFKDSAREFDLSRESDLADLRREVELRMRNSVKKGKTVSNEVISMTVKGPGLSRMVLVDLPGVISTQTMDMAEDTKDSIIKMSMDYMSNPNSIILCIQDGSVDAERSNVTDLVSQMDPSGKRTIFVLTKVDLAEQNLTNPERIQQILSGKLFPMKALGYFAVVTGRGNNSDSIADIKHYEDNFFRSSKLFRVAGVGSSTQYTTKNLSFAVSECFWKMVRETVEQQADTFKAIRFNLETEWKNNYPRIRELDRDELYEKCRGEILDQTINLSLVSAKEWEGDIQKKLFDAMNNHIFENIYIPACITGAKSRFNTTVDIRLKQWAEESLAEKCVLIGWLVLRDKFMEFLEKEKNSKQHDTIFDQLKHSVVEEAFKRHSWEEKANEVLRVIQLNTLQDRAVSDKVQWDKAVKFMEDFLTEKLKTAEKMMHEMVGPGFTERWMYWKSMTKEQHVKSMIKSELERLMNQNAQKQHSANLSQDEYNIVKRQLEGKGIKVDFDEIRKTWSTVYRRHFIKSSLDKCYECRKGFWIYSKNVDNSELDCAEVVLFWRIQQMLKVTSNALRQQVVNREAKRLEKEIKEVLEEWSTDEDKKKALLTGRRVTLAEDLKRVRQVQDKLEEFITYLNSEK